MSPKNLVLFFSWSGNTRRIAQVIAEKTGADIRELQLEVPYPEDHDTMDSQVQRELQQKQYPALRSNDMDWNAYNVIYLGTPNWWSSPAPPVISFLHEVMPTEKTIVPFCTHGGGGAGHIAHDIRTYCIGCDVLTLLSVQGDGGTQAEKLVERWLEHIDV